MMHNYWIGVMAAAFVVAMAIWLLLVFNADRHPVGRPRDSQPHREVIGGEFEARGGGRQVMPIPGQRSGADQEAGAGQGAEAGRGAEASRGAEAGRDKARAERR